VNAGAEGRAPNLPYPAAIESYGNGGFRFAGMSHRGSLLCLPDGVWAWPPVTPSEIDEASLAPLFAASASAPKLALIGTGATPWDMPAGLRRTFRDHGITVEVMTTRPAVRTYNILLGERRSVAAALIAVE
jgi:uncharacterized protein